MYCTLSTVSCFSWLMRMYWSYIPSITFDRDTSRWVISAVSDNLVQTASLAHSLHVFALPWVPEFYIKTWNPSRMIAYVENSARPETWARDTGLAEYTVLRNSNAVFAQLVPRLASFCHQRFKQEGSVISKTCRVAGTALLAVEAVTASVHAN